MLEETKYFLQKSVTWTRIKQVEQALILCRERKPMGILFLGEIRRTFKENMNRLKCRSPDHKLWKRIAVGESFECIGR